MKQTILDIGHEGIVNDVTPGGSVGLVSRDQPLQTISFGTLGRAESESSPVNAQTIYDVASLTKPLCTSALTMKALGTGEIKLEGRVAALLPELNTSEYSEVTFRQLLGHGGGFPAHRKFYEELGLNKARGHRQDRSRILQLVFETEAAYAPGTQTLYSDLGFITLGAALERLYQMRLDRIFETEVAVPLKLERTFFVDLTQNARLDRSVFDAIAPTEACTTRGRLRGVVHDENCDVLGGIAGHAGMFSCLSDVAKMTDEWLKGCQGTSKLFNPHVLRQCLKLSASSSTSWRLGFDTPSETKGVSHAGELWPRSSYGHLGFTGTSMWMEPERGRACIILTNRVYETRAPEGIKALRRQIMDAAAAQLFEPAG